MRVVYDTNVLISGLFWDGPPRELIKKAIDGQVELVVSEFILKELAETLLDSFGLFEKEVSSILEKVGAISIIVCPAKSLHLVRDKDDNRILECAVEGECDYLVTGDSDLLSLREHHGVRIVSPRDFLDLR